MGAPDERVNLTGARALDQVGAIGSKWVLQGFRLLVVAGEPGAPSRVGLVAALFLCVVDLGDPVGKITDDIQAADALLLQKIHRVGVWLAEDAHQDIAAVDLGFPRGAYVHDRALHHALKRDRLHRLAAQPLGEGVDVGVQKFLQVRLQLPQVASHAFKDLARRFVKAEHVEQVLQGQIFVAALAGFAHGRRKCYFQVALDHGYCSRSGIPPPVCRGGVFIESEYLCVCKKPARAPPRAPYRGRPRLLQVGGSYPTRVRGSFIPAPWSPSGDAPRGGPIPGSKTPWSRPPPD